MVLIFVCAFSFFDFSVIALHSDFCFCFSFSFYDVDSYYLVKGYNK